MGGVIIILNRGMGERLTYGIPARYRVVLIQHLGGFFFDGRRSCTAQLLEVLIFTICTSHKLMCATHGFNFNIAD